MVMVLVVWAGGRYSGGGCGGQRVMVVHSSGVVILQKVEDFSGRDGGRGCGHL